MQASTSGVTLKHLPNAPSRTQNISVNERISLNLVFRTTIMTHGNREYKKFGR
jgi:hypothetical protein